MKREFVDPSTTTEADRALRLRKDLAAAQAKLREAEQWREQAARAARLERELAEMDARRQELELQVRRLDKRPSQARLRRAEALAAEVEGLRSRAQRVPALEKDLADTQAKLREAEHWRDQAAKAARLEREAATLRERVSELEGQVKRLRERSASTPRHVERCAQAKLNRKLFQENERLKQEARHG